MEKQADVIEKATEMKIELKMPFSWVLGKYLEEKAFSITEQQI